MLVIVIKALFLVEEILDYSIVSESARFGGLELFLDFFGVVNFGVVFSEFELVVIGVVG
jgi:hypothetical protein